MAGFLFPGIQCHLKGIGAQAVLVVIVLPNLPHSQVPGGGHMGIGQAGDAVFLCPGRRIAQHGVFRPGIHNLLAACVSGQTVRRQGPAVLSPEGIDPLHIAGPAGEPHGYKGGTHAVLVVIVHPGFHHPAACGLRVMGIGQGGPAAVDAADAGVARHGLLLPAVVNLPALVKPGQVHGGIGPLHAGGQGHFTDCRDFPFHFSHKGDRQGIRAHAVLVLLIVPHLVDGGGGGFGHMGVGEDRVEAAFHAALVAGRLLLAPGIGHFLAADKHGQILHLHLPGVLLCQREGILDPGFPGPLRVQRHGEGRRTDAVLVVIVIPDFFRAGSCHPGGMGVDEAGKGAFCFGGNGVSVRQRLLPAVGDPLPVCIHGNSAGFAVPEVFFIQGHGGGFPVAGKELHQQGCGPDAVLVIIIKPGLFHRQHLGFRHMGVDQGGGSAVHPGFRCIARNLGFRPGVGNSFSVFICRKACDAAGPAVFLVKDYASGFPGFIPQGGRQIYGDLRRPQAVLIILILPVLGHQGQGGIRLVAVGQGGDIAGLQGTAEDIILDFLFLPGIDNLPAPGVHREAFHGGLPAIFFRQFHRAGAVALVPGLCHEHSGDLFRPFAVLVVAVVPFLLQGLGRCFRNMGIGHDRQGRILAVRGGCGGIVLNGLLRPGVHNLPAAVIHGQVLNLRFPALFCRNGHFRHGGVVCGEEHLQGFGPFAVLVYIVLPDLPDPSCRGGDIVMVYDGGLIPLCLHGQKGIFRHSLFPPGIFHLFCLMVHGQARHFRRPAVFLAEYLFRQVLPSV